MKWSLMSEKETSEISESKILAFEETLMVQHNLLRDAIPNNQVKFSKFGFELQEDTK